MALVRVCDKCLTMVENKEYVDITYHRRREGSFLSSSISQTLCVDCFNKIFGSGHLELLSEMYEREFEEKVQHYMEGNE